MRITVKYFAQARPAAGRSEESVALRESSSVKDLLITLADAHGEALRHLLLTSDGQPHPSLLLFMHDRQITSAARTTLADADEIILLPPMAGG